MRCFCLILSISALSSILPVIGQVTESGPLAVYAAQLHGRPTASGGVYDRGLLTAAHASLPFGTLVRVANFDTGRMVDVMINDRKGQDGRLLNLSEAAANSIQLSPRAVVHGSMMEIGRVSPPPSRVQGGGVSSRISAAPQPPVVAAGSGASTRSKNGLRLFRPMASADQSVTRPAAPNRGTPELMPLNASTRPPSGTVSANYPSTRSPAVSPAVIQKASPAAPYRVQFGAFRRAGNANELSSMLGSAGIPASVFASPDTGLNVVVTNSGFRSAEEAQRWIDFEGARRGWRERPVVIR